jgi:hypothetical protein
VDLTNGRERWRTPITGSTGRGALCGTEVLIPWGQTILRLRVEDGAPLGSVRAQTMDDLRAHEVDLLTLGQYLQPTARHLPVERFVSPEQFDRYRDWALERGFRECVSGPLVRSSYRAEQALAGNNAGLDNAALSELATPRR